MPMNLPDEPFFAASERESVGSKANGQFKHIEWDGWGGGPVGDWTAYVV
jgi:hypothetical protein